MEETIYNIIPKHRPYSAKEPRYSSKYPPNIPPSYSTFNLGTTSKPGVSNPAGQLQEVPLSHTPYGEAKTLGYLKGQRRPIAQNYRLKQTGTMGSNKLPEKEQFSYNCSHRKTPIPKDKPLHGLHSAKNFVLTNAIQNILSVPKVQIAPIDWTKKKDFGKVPKYITKVKEHIENENKLQQKLRRESSDERHCLSVAEVDRLKTDLNRKWNEVNKEYQSITHKGNIDTLGLKKKKQDCEKQLNDLEKDIKKLQKIHKYLSQ